MSFSPEGDAERGSDASGISCGAIELLDDGMGDNYDTGRWCLRATTNGARRAPS